MFNNPYLPQNKNVSVTVSNDGGGDNILNNCYELGIHTHISSSHNNPVPIFLFQTNEEIGQRTYFPKVGGW